MKAIRNFLLIALILFTAGCDDLLDENLTVAERLEGRWSVQEENPYKNAEDAYYVYIDISPVDSNTVLIDKFFNTLSSAYANISGMTLILPSQDVEGFLLRGTGTISSNYKQITWHLYADDHSGIEEEVTAVYVKEDY